MPGVTALYRAINYNVLEPDSTTFFYDLVLQAMANRKREAGGNKSRNHDLVDLMIRALKEDLAAEAEATEQFEKDAALNYK